MEQNTPTKQLPQIPWWFEDRMLDIPDFSAGLRALEDTTKAPIGSARTMTNAMITDAGGISNRPGTVLLGALNASTHGAHGFYNFKKSDGVTEIPVRSYNQELEYFHPTLQVWARLMNGFTADQEFGFREHLVNTDNQDYLYYCNRTENYSRWIGETAQTTTNTTGVETTLPVDSIAKAQVFASGAYNTYPNHNGTVSGSGTGTSFADSAYVSSWQINGWIGATLTFTSGVNNGNTYNVVGNNFGAGGAFVINTSITYSNGDTFTVQFPGVSKTQIWDNTANANGGSTTNGWGSSQWINFFIQFTSGSNAGQISNITANAANGFTLGTALVNNPANGDAYNIIQTKFPASGTLMVNGVQVQYSAIASATGFTITPTGVAIPTGSPVTLIPAVFPQDPKGNCLEVNYTRMIVGNAMSGSSLNSSGTLQGFSSPRAWYYSHGGLGLTANASDFTYSGTRTAGQGGVEAIAYGGGNITDIANQEDTFYVFTKNYIEADKFSQDSNDLPQRIQLKTGFGSINKTIKAKDDIYFFTADNQYTSIGRVKLKDTLPQHVNMGLPIKRILDTMDFTKVRGIEYKHRLFAAAKNLPTDAANNRVIVYNEQTKSFEGIWELTAFDFMKYQGNLYYIDSTSPNVYQMFQGQSDQLGSNVYPINMKWLSNWMNLTPKRRNIPKSSFAEQSVDAIGVEGYIRGGTNITFELYADFANSASISFTFGGTQQQFLDGSPLSVFMGDNPMGVEPLGMYTLPDQSGNIHFSFVIYFPPVYSNFFSMGVLNNGTDQYFEVSRLAVGVAEDTIYSTKRINTSLNAD